MCKFGFREFLGLPFSRFRRGQQGFPGPCTSARGPDWNMKSLRQAGEMLGHLPIAAYRDRTVPGSNRLKTTTLSRQGGEILYGRTVTGVLVVSLRQSSIGQEADALSREGELSSPGTSWVNAPREGGADLRFPIINLPG